MAGKRTYDLEERTYEFARDCRLLIRELTKTITNIEDGKQLIKSSGSIGANYIEANENLGGKDLKFRLKISIKEAKESKYWLRLLGELNDNCIEEISRLISKPEELRKIFSAIINKI
jgi:four helix bundle protein